MKKAVENYVPIGYYTVERGFFIMNVKRKSKLDVVIRILLIALVAVLVVFAVKVVFSAAKTAPVAADATANEDKSVIGEFQAGTYGGIKMDTAEDAVKYYVEAYNKTKAETAEFNTPDGKQTWSAFIGDEDLKINSVIIDGNENKTINSMVPGIVGGIFHSGTSALPPTAGKVQKDDVDEKGNSLVTSSLTADDVLAVVVEDNGDGTITMKIQPKMAEMSHKGQDSQGRFFNTLGGIDSVVDSIKPLSWSEGTTADNCKVYYKGGTGVVKIDTKTGMIVEADYDMEVTVDVSHANVTVLRDKSAVVSITYKNHFPASDEYLAQHGEISRVK